MKTSSWLRRLTRRRKNSRQPKQRFSERFAATLSIKPLESRLVLNATVLDLNGGVLTLSDTTPFQNDAISIAPDAVNQRYVIKDNSVGGTIGLTANAVTNGATLQSANTAWVPFNKVTSAAATAITVNLADGNDSLTIDLSNGELVDNLTYNGGNPTTGTGDSLTLIDTTLRTFPTVTHTPTSASGGTITITPSVATNDPTTLLPIANRTITYAGLEPITDGLLAADRTFNFSSTGETITFQDAGTANDGFNLIDSPLSESITFRNPTNSLTINAGVAGADGDDIVLVNRLDDDLNPTLGVTINGGGFSTPAGNRLTIATTDRPNPANIYSFAGFTFDQTLSFDRAQKLAPDPGNTQGYNGVAITSDIGDTIDVVNFPENPTAGFNPELTVGGLLDGVVTTGSRPLNLPDGNVGTVARAGIELDWLAAGQSLSDQAGDDFVVYESANSLTGPDGFIVQVHQKNGGWSRWRYEAPDGRQLYVGSASSGAFATAFDIADFGLNGALPLEIDAIRIAGLTGSDRIEGPGVESAVGSGIYRGQGFVIPQDGGLTSDTFPDPGAFASFTSFGNSTFDPDPLYVGMLHPLAGTTNLRSDTIEVQDNQVRLVLPETLTFTHAGFAELTVDSAGGIDQITVDLGRLPVPVAMPSKVNITGGDPNGDTLTVLGNDAAVDTLTLEGATIAVTGGPTLTLATVENLVIDTQDTSGLLIDVTTVKRGFTLSGVSPTIQVNGNNAVAGVGGDELVVDTEAPVVVASGDTFTAAPGITFYQDATPDHYVNHPLGTISGGHGAVVTTTSFTTNSLTGFPESGTGTFNAALSLGRLAAGGTGVRRLNLAGSNNRNAFTLDWLSGATLEDQAGNDIVIYEQGTSKAGGGGPEAFMIQVHDPNTGAWSQWRYHQATSQTTPDGAQTVRFATVYDLQQFITPDFLLAGGEIDAIRVANLVPNDRVSNAAGDGFVYLAEVYGGGTGFAPTALAALSNYTTFSAGTLNPDLVYLGILHPLQVPQTQGVGDTVVIDFDSVNVQGFIPIDYAGIKKVTVETKGGADFVTAKPSIDTTYDLRLGDPALPTAQTDRLAFDLSELDDVNGNTGALLTMTDPGTGVLTHIARKAINVSGVDSFGIPATLGATAATFDVFVNAASASGAPPANDTFVVDRDDALTRVTVNGEVVFRGDVHGLRTLTIDGSADRTDLLTVDFVGDNPIPRGGLVFRGKENSPAEDQFDQLTVVRGSVASVTHKPSGRKSGLFEIGESASDRFGAVTEVISVIDYDGVDTTILDLLLTKNRTFEFGALIDDVQILDDALSIAGRSLVQDRVGATFRDVEFVNPTVALTIKGNAGADKIALDGIDPAFAAALNLYGGAAADAFKIGKSGRVDFVKFPINVQGNAPLDPNQPGGTGTANPTEDDTLEIDDSLDNDGSIYGVTETTVGGENLPSGAALGATTPNLGDTVIGAEWNNVPVAFQTGPRPTQSQQTILHWLTVDGTGRILLDDSVNGNNGTLFPATVAGKPGFGNALEFDGVDDYAWFQDPSFNIGAEGTFSFWVYMDNLTRRNTFLNSSSTFPGNGMEFEYRENNDGELFVYLNKTSSADNSLILQNGTGTPEFPDTAQWVNIQYTWNFVGQRAAIYINGQQVQYRSGFGDPVTTWSQPLNTVDALMQLGRHRNEARYFDGKMDDVAFFNKALTPVELAKLVANPVGAVQASDHGVFDPVGVGTGALVAYWNMDHPAGATILTGDAGTSIALNVERMTDGARFLVGGGPVLPKGGAPIDAVVFDGDEDAIRVADSASLDFSKSQGTVSFWINPTAEQVRNTLLGNTSTLIEDSTGQVEIGISWQDDAGASLDRSDIYGRVFLALKGNSPNEPTNILVSDSRLKFGDWTHVTVAWETVAGQVQAKVYFNGQNDGYLFNNLDATGLGAVNTGSWTVGGDANAGLHRWFEGRLADISIWGHALSAERVDSTFRNGAATTNAWDYAGATAKFAWDATNLYGLVTGPNGPFSDLVVTLYDANGVQLLPPISPASPNGATITANADGSYEFAVPFSALGAFDPNSPSFLQYTIRARDPSSIPPAGFDSALTTLGYVTPPLAGTATGLSKLNFVGRESLFGVGGRLTYHGLADLTITNGSGIDHVTLSDDPLVNNDATANPARSFTLLTGGGADMLLQGDQVTIASLDAGYFAQTTIRTNALSTVPTADGIDTITQLAAFTLGSARSNGELYLEADQIRLDANSSTKGAVKIDGAVTLTSDVRIETTFAGSTGQNVWFTNFSTINSESAEANNLVLDTALGRVFFNADIGNVNGGELGRLEIRRAAEIIFGQANTATPATGQGPVTLVRVTGDGTAAAGINLGSLQAIGVAGITLNGGVGNLLRMQTTGDAIRVNGAVKLATDVVFDTDTTDNNTHGGDIRFTSAAPIDSATQKNLSFDAGTASIFFNANLGAGSPLGAITVDEADGGVTFGETSPVDTVRATGAVNIGVGLNVIGGTGITLNGGPLGFTLTTTDQNVRFNGKVTLLSDVLIDTGLGGAGDIVFTSDSPIESPIPRDLTLIAGTGAVEFNGNIGENNRLLKKLTVEVARKVTFGAADVAAIGGAGPVTVVRTDDAINLGSNAAVTDGVVLNGGATELVVTTTGDQIHVNGAVTLGSDVKLVTNGGDLLFTLAATINSEASEANNLVLDAGPAAVRFNNDVGAAASGDLGRLEIQRAGTVIFGEANSPGGGQGPVTLVRVTGDGTAAAGVDLGSLQAITSILFNGGAGDQFRIESTGDAIRVNGATQFATNVTLDTDAADNNSHGGNITFTSAAPIDSAGNKTFTLDAGTASIFFSANLGGAQELGAITVDEADGGVTFGDTAPVNLIRSTGIVNIGVGTNVIGGTGITFNGGVGGLTLSTPDQLVRLNGKVTLLSDVRIDTGLGGAGDIVFTSDSPIESPTPRDLTLNAGTGAVEFNANIGENNRLLKKLTVEVARKITFGAADVAVTGGAGPVTVVRTDDAINLGSAAVVNDGVIFNGGANELEFTTTGDLIRVNGATTLQSDLRFTAAGGDVFFTTAAPIDSDPAGGNGFTLDSAAGDITFSAAVGAVNPLAQLTILSADDAIFVSVLQVTGAVTQSAGTGLTRFNGTTGGGIGGALNVTTDRVEFGTSDVNTIGAVTVTTQNAISFLANAGLNATASVISLSANQDNTGSEGFTQDSSALIQTTNDTAAAVFITVGGTGDARIARIHTGTAVSGTITMIVGGAIIDNRVNEDANLVTRIADLTAGSGIGAMNNDLDSTVAFVTAFTANQDFVLDETDAITLRDITADNGTVFVNAGGVLAIQNGSILESQTGRASNAPPLLTLAEDNPADVLLPGDPTQEVRGQIGAGGLNAGNLEFGENFTLVVTWDDGQTSVLGGLSAGDNVVWLVDANNNSTVTVTPGPAPGPIDIFIQRTYPLPYLQLLNKTEVTAQFTLFNDALIQLFDVTPINLNQTVTFGIDTAISKKDFGVPTLAVVEEALITFEEPAGTVLLESPPLVPAQQIIFRQDELIEEKKEDEEAVLYLVRVGADGEEGKQIRLPLEDLRDLAQLLEKLKKAQIPSGLYRIYHQEPGLPPRKVLEFRKAGNMIGDPVREPGRGANPQEAPQQGDGANEELPPADKPAGTGAEGTDAASDARQASLDAALREVTAASFTRAARLRRRG